MMNEQFAADIALMASIARVIECDARHNLRLGKLALILPSLRDFRDTVNMMVEKWEARLDTDS